MGRTGGSICSICKGEGHDRRNCPAASTVEPTSNGAPNGVGEPVVRAEDPHPLFPAEVGRPVPEIHFVNVMRNGMHMPVTFEADQLVTYESIEAQFGGGSYKLLGRQRSAEGTPGRIVAISRFTLPGDPKPIGGVAIPPMLNGGRTGPMPPTDGSMGSMMMWMMMQQQQREDERARREEDRHEREETRRAAEAAAQAAREDRHQAMMLNLLTRPAPPPDPTLGTVLAAALNRPPPTDHTPALIAAMQAKSSEGGVSQMIETFKNGISIGKDVAAKTETTSEIVGAIAPLAAPVIGAIAQAAVARAQANGAPAPPPPPQAQPGQLAPPPTPPPQQLPNITPGGPDVPPQYGGNGG
jgi:hypothetical protein